jgi:hypothetical protein
MRKLHFLLAIVVISWLASLASAQGVADLARQERARKKALESKAVLTNGSQPASTPDAAKPGTATPATADTQKEAAKPAASTGPTDNKGRDEKYWRATFDKARQDLKRAEDKVTLLDLKLNDLQGQLYREGVYQREMEIRKDIDDTQKAQAAAREDVEACQRRISDLEDELRRSGGLPGWAR